MPSYYMADDGSGTMRVLFRPELRRYAFVGDDVSCLYLQNGAANARLFVTFDYWRPSRDDCTINAENFCRKHQFAGLKPAVTRVPVVGGGHSPDAALIAWKLLDDFLPSVLDGTYRHEVLRAGIRQRRLTHEFYATI